MTAVLDLTVLLDIWGQPSEPLEEDGSPARLAFAIRWDDWKVRFALYTRHGSVRITDPDGVTVEVQHRAMADSLTEYVEEVFPGLERLMCRTSDQSPSALDRLFAVVRELHRETARLLRMPRDEQPKVDLSLYLAWVSAGFTAAERDVWQPLFEHAHDPFDGVLPLEAARSLRDAGFGDAQEAVRWIRWAPRGRVARDWARRGWTPEDVDALAMDVEDGLEPWQVSNLTPEQALRAARAGLRAQEAVSLARSGGPEQGVLEMLGALR